MFYLNTQKIKTIEKSQTNMTRAKRLRQSLRKLRNLRMVLTGEHCRVDYCYSRPYDGEQGIYKDDGVIVRRKILALLLRSILS